MYRRSVRGRLFSGCFEANSPLPECRSEYYRLCLDKDDRKSNDSGVGSISLSRWGFRAMPYGLPKDLVGSESSLALVVIGPACRSILVGTPCFEAGMPGPESWMAVYRLAYEQARAALEPSLFQKLLAPSRN